MEGNFWNLVNGIFKKLQKIISNGEMLQISPWDWKGDKNSDQCNIQKNELKGKMI